MKKNEFDFTMEQIDNLSQTVMMLSDDYRKVHLELLNHKIIMQDLVQTQNSIIDYIKNGTNEE